jgi:glc operon protein GlcG
MALTLEKAEIMIKGAIAKAKELGIIISVVVVDAGGHPIAISRMDGARFLSADISRGKAFTAAAFQRESGSLGGVPFFASGPQVGGGMIVALPGGIPIREGDEVVGAIGCGGGTGEQDVECAKAGIEALMAASR